MQQKKYILVLAAIFLMACQSQSQKVPVKTTPPKEKAYVVPAKLRAIVSAIENTNRLESSHVGFAGSPSTQWAYYEQLKKAATAAELTALTSHKNVAVRCYAFQALAAKKAPNVFAVLQQHLQDKATVELMEGCIVSEIQARDYFIDVVSGSIESGLYTLSAAEKQAIAKVYVRK